jgi:biopolymer transport protein TolQ
MNDILRFVLNTGTMAKVVLAFLSLLSILSWAIILEKIWHFFKIGQESKQFLQSYKERTGWNSLYNASKSYQYSPYPFVFTKAYGELYTWKRRWQTDEGGEESNKENGKGPFPTTLSQIMESVITESLSRADKRLSVLSITVSVSPFLGLFGTVWGVMIAFMSIGITGSADISTVGPGIAQALITTVAGLAVAIPALIAYNLIASRLRRLEDHLGIFSTELIRLFEREKLS